MPRSEEFDDLRDSLDRVEYLMALADALIDEINADPSLTPVERDQLIREFEVRIQRRWEGDDLDDDSALSIYIRKLGPRGPGSRSGSIALRPEIEPADPSQNDILKQPSPPRRGRSDDAAFSDL